MNTSFRVRPSTIRARSRLVAFLVGAVAALSALPGGAATDISQSPLYVGSQVPGNLSLVPSVEFPTLISVANRDVNYASSKVYVGYFNSDRCYSYVYSDTESERHFYPEELAVGRKCNTPKRWSGNYLNWTTTQTIDPFRSALTGGYRVADTTTKTWLEKAVADRESASNFPRRTVWSGGEAPGATPASWGSFMTRIDGLGNKMRFTDAANVVTSDPGNAKRNYLAIDPLPNRGGVVQPIPYNPDVHSLDNSQFLGVEGWKVVYEVSVRVAVCVSGKEEANCTKYPGGASKPEGLLQEYSDRLRYSIFGYINNGPNPAPDGGVMRARQKFIGPLTHYPAQANGANDGKEWDPGTGIFIRNPDVNDGASTATAVIKDSGVINYLNKFGQMETGRKAKSYDNVSELYYAVTRYFRGIGNVPEYSQLSADADIAYQEADGFPVITDWDDPIKYSCQANVILGIGDTNTWEDKNLPGEGTSTTSEPAEKPAKVSGDLGVDVVKSLVQIFRMENASLTHEEAMVKAVQDAYNGNLDKHKNSAYIAALAYDAHTRDIRLDRPGNQSISTYWVDVVEGGDYKVGTNQYALAAKYGGFTVPAGFNPYPDTPVALTDASWWSGELVNGLGNFKRPANFYTADEAGKMVESLRRAFESIVAEIAGSGASFAANTTSLEAGAQSFQARFYSGTWRGELSAYSINPATGALSDEPLWNAGSKFAADWQERNIWVNSGGHKKLSWSTLESADSSVFGSEEIVNYLRGDRSNEGLNGLRVRQGVLGDIINSEPVYVGSPNPRLYLGATFSGADKYQAYVAAKASRKPVVYVGANDGMLHGFDAGSDSTTAGSETYAFMPSAAITSKLKSYTSKEYVHKFSVDGEMTVADVYDGTKWRSVLVGTMGRGGKGAFALDVTDPTDVKFLWEKTSDALGNNLGKPLIGQVADGVWKVAIGGGPNNASGGSALLLVDVMTGSTQSVSAGTGPGNGLSAVRLWDSDADGFVDSAYAGDLAGNVWRFSNLGGSPTPSKLFTANGPDGSQAITAAPMVARNPANGATWVFFGTGSYLSTGDLADKKVQSWYGLIDAGTTIVGRGNLSKTSILAEAGSARAVSLASTVGVSGWYMDLVSPVDVKRGERMVVSNRFQGTALVGTTRIPDASDPCAPSGIGYVMAIDPFTGGRLSASFFDIDGDGTVGDEGDLVDVDGNKVPASGLKLESGPNNPIFVGDIMQVTLDDGRSKSVKTHSGGNTIRRVSWREVVGG